MRIHFSENSVGISKLTRSFGIEIGTLSDGVLKKCILSTGFLSFIAIIFKMN